jgi:CheY-like chemotaxis protein
MEKKIDKRILIVSDTAEELDDVKHILTSEFGEVLKANNANDGLKLFREQQPHVLVLAFQDIAGSEAFYLSIFDQDPDEHIVPHHSLVLCRNKESGTAYELCKKGMFDDYVADRPLYDPFRLRLSLLQAITRISQDDQIRDQHQRLESINNGIQEFKQEIRQILTSRDGKHGETVQAFRSFIESLSKDLDGLEQRLASDKSIANGASVDKQGLHDQFDRFHRDAVVQGSKRVSDHLTETDNLQQTFDHTFGSHVKLGHEAIQVMLVDDDEFYREAIAVILEENGISTEGIEDGKAALDRLQYCTPKVILLDYNMPGMDGITTLKRIKSNPGTSVLPVIMLTAVSEREIVKQCVSAGANDYIIKSGDHQTMVSKINAVLSR